MRTSTLQLPLAPLGSAACPFSCALASALLSLSLIMLASLVLMTSCMVTPPPQKGVEELSHPFVEDLPRIILVEEIMGSGALSANELASFLLVTNEDLEDAWVRSFVKIYVEEAAFEGVNHDIAFAQMCLETGFLRFGNLVTPDMNNFCGLGAIGPGQSGERFETVQLGVRAHVQHLKAYATTEPLNGELVDPRFKWVRYGSSPSFRGLAGTWAADPLYADKIESILKRMFRLAGFDAQVQPIDVPTKS